MPIKVLDIRVETPEEAKLREWFAVQLIESPKNIEEAARLLIGLVTGLLGVLFTVLTISAENLPVYLSFPIVRISGVAAVALWLVSLVAALIVVLPREWQSAPGKPDTQQLIFHAILDRKSTWLTIAAINFGLAIIALSIVLITALMSF